VRSLQREELAGDADFTQPENRRDGVSYPLNSTMYQATSSRGFATGTCQDLIVKRAGYGVGASCERAAYIPA
jgi:hypothetical protein